MSATPPGIERFVYYRIHESDTAAALAAFQAAVPAGSVRLMRRLDAGAGALQTWMEVHAAETGAQTEPALAAALAAFVQGPRHLEQFVPV